MSPRSAADRGRAAPGATTPHVRLERTGQTVYLSATPGTYELSRVKDDVVEQVIRPTGLVDPEVVVKPTKGQIDDLIHEIKLRAERDERVLVTTLTKKMAGPHRLPARDRHPRSLPAQRGGHAAPGRAVAGTAQG